MQNNNHQQKKECFFTKHNVKNVDYRDVHLLEMFISQHGKITPRKKTHTCAQMQRKVERAVMLARYMALIPYVRQ